MKNIQTLLVILTGADELETDKVSKLVGLYPN